MSAYFIENSKTELENVNICLGYDEGFKGFWLYIQDMSFEGDDDHYIFHNIINVDGVKMKLNQVESVLESHGYKLDKDVALEMIQDSINDGYLNTLDVKERKMFIDFIKKFN